MATVLLALGLIALCILLNTAASCFTIPLSRTLLVGGGAG